MNRKTILLAAATYIGTVVGAGFASGQEVLQFFSLLGPKGFWGLLFSVAGFWFLGFLIMDLGRILKAKSHLPVIKHIGGKFLSPILDFLMTFFLLGAFSAMAAGAGAILSQELGAPWILGASLLGLTSYITVSYGLKGIVSAISWVVPFLMVGVLGVSLAVLLNLGLHLSTPPTWVKPLMKGWPLAGYTYLSYNIVMAVPVLSSLGSIMKDRRTALLSSFWGALGLGFSMSLIYLALMSSFPISLSHEIPMAQLSLFLHPWGKGVYIAIFLAEVYTTGVADLYGMAARIKDPDSLGFKKVAFLLAALGVFLAKIGFTNLVRSFYSLTGWAGTLFILALILDFFKRAEKSAL